MMIFIMGMALKVMIKICAPLRRIIRAIFSLVYAYLIPPHFLFFNIKMVFYFIISQFII